MVCLVVCALFGLSFGQENDFRGTLSILQPIQFLNSSCLSRSFSHCSCRRQFQRRKGTLFRLILSLMIDPKSKGHDHSHIPDSRRGISRSIPKLVSSRAWTQRNLSPLGPSLAPTAVPSPSLLLTSTVAGHPPPFKILMLLQMIPIPFVC